MMVLRRKCVAYLILDKTCIYITSKTRPGPGGMHVVLMIQESFFFFGLFSRTVPSNVVLRTY
jgi:hypothetical protein